MAATLETPIDEATGIPLSVAPPLEYLPRNNPNVANWHHLWHPHSSPELATLGGWALRNSRIQLLPIRDHNEGKHTYHTYFAGPPLPEADDEDTQFRLCVLSCAGYLPDDVIDIKGYEPVRRRMTDAERAVFVRSPIPQPVLSDEIQRHRVKLHHDQPDIPLPSKGEMRRLLQGRNNRNAELSYNNFRYAYDPIRDFFRAYALRRPLSHIKNTYIDEFLSTRQPDRRKTLGHWLLAKQSEVATEPVRSQYTQAKRTGSLHPMMPKRADILVKNKLGSKVDREALFPVLEEALQAA